MPDHVKEMSFFDHLEELRWRLFRVGGVILLFARLAFAFKGFVFDNIIKKVKFPIIQSGLDKTPIVAKEFLLISLISPETSLI